LKYAAGYGLALVLFLALDALWLGLVARGTYVARMGDLLADPPRWGVAALFYVVYVVGLTYFAIAPGIEGKGWTSAALNGALFGFFCYLTYDATALSVIKGFDPVLAAVDVAWGTFLSAVCAGLSVAVLSWTRLGGA
jgi:uncharacterized membrane protein